MCPCVVSFLPLLPLPPLMLSTDVTPATKWNVLQLIDCSPLRSILITGTSSLLWALLTSHSSLLLRLMRPPVRPPRLRCTLFPLIYLPHLLVLPATFGLHRFRPTYPHFPALYVVPVRQAKGLPTASFRSYLTIDTLAVQLCTSSLPTRTRDLHPLERAHGAQTEKRTAAVKRQPPSRLLYRADSLSFVSMDPVYPDRFLQLMIVSPFFNFDTIPCNVRGT